MYYNDYAIEIKGLKDADLRLRDQLIKEGLLYEGYNSKMEELHNENAKRLNQIMIEIGYPTIDKVGKEGSEAAWLIIQHSISQPDFMRMSLSLLENAVDNQEADPIHMVYLSDRISVFEGRPQLYGTSFDWAEEGALLPNEYDDLEAVNQRRKSLGLNTIEEQIKVMNLQAKRENQQPPANFKERKAQMDAWRKRVGWIE